MNKNKKGICLLIMGTLMLIGGGIAMNSGANDVRRARREKVGSIPQNPK